MKRSIYLLFGMLFLYSCSCNNSDNKKTEIPDVQKDKLPNVQVSVKRYEKALFGIDKSKLKQELKRLQPEYALFLDGDLEDKQNLLQLGDYLSDNMINDNYQSCVKKYPDMAFLERDLSTSFSYYKFWFPEKKIPKVFTYVSGGDFDQTVKNADSALVIALDMYLGSDYTFYASCGVPYYKAHWMDKPYIARDCMEELGIAVCGTDKKDADFLDQMINMGKLMYFLDVTMPYAADSIKIKYTGKWLDWCKTNEGNVWAFFIDNKVLYTKDKETFLKFFSDGPSTSSFGKESPPRIAIWVGWQIVRAYMSESPGSDIKKLIAETDSQKILQISKYKPKKK
jgi:hypothetical protein